MKKRIISLLLALIMALSLLPVACWRRTTTQVRSM